MSSGDVSATSVKTFAQAAGGGGGTDAKTTVSKVNENQTWFKQVRINGRLTNCPEGAVEQIQGREKKLQKGVIGKAQNSGLRTVQKTFRQRRANVFATRFDPAVSEQTLQL